MKRIVLLTLLAATATVPAQAANLDNIISLDANQFRLLTEDLGAALSYKPLTPAEPLGLFGFDLGVQGTYTELSNSGVYKQATGSNDSSFVLPQAHLYMGLPLGFDVGVSYATLPDSNIQLYGAELRYAILSGSTTQPAIGVRLSYTTLAGVSQLDFHTTGLDLSISKGIAFFTPYAGIGSVWASSKATISTGPATEDVQLTKYFLGVNMNLAIINIAVEADRTGDATSYGAKIGWRF